MQIIVPRMLDAWLQPFISLVNQKTKPQSNRLVGVSCSVDSGLSLSLIDQPFLFRRTSYCTRQTFNSVSISIHFISSECSGDLVISECADIVPYNISAAVNADQQTAKDWGVILSQANTCHGDAGIFVCAVLQRKCTVDGPILPCRALCERVAHCDLTSSDLPYSSRSCGTYPDSLNYLDCFDVMYEG